MKKTFYYFTSIFLGLSLSCLGQNFTPTTTFKSFTKIETGFGPEDFVLDTVFGERLLISCDERRELTTQGSIWQYNITTKKAELLPFVPNLTFDFHPHGVHLIVSKDTTYLFVINHIGKKNSEIDRFIVFKNKLVLDKRFTDCIGNPNDIFAVNSTNFYYTDYQTFGGSLIHYNKKYSKAIKHLKMPNGLFLENDTIYVTTTLNGKFYKTNITTIHKKYFTKVKGGDNIMPFSKSEFLVTSHQNFNQFIKHAKNKSHKSPSLVYAVNKQTGKKEVLYYNSGEQISAVSTAFLYKNKLYLGQVFDNFILVYF